MRGLTISSLALILALSSTVAVAAPRAAVSPMPKTSPYYNKGASNLKSARCNLIDSENGYCQDKRSASCKIRGACSSLSPPDTCCGTCILIDISIGYCQPPGSALR